MLIHLRCLVRKSRTMAWRRTEHCSLRVGYLFSCWALPRGSVLEVSLKKIWEGAEQDGYFQSWSQHNLSGKLWLCGRNLNGEGILPLKYSRRVEKRMLLFPFLVVLTAWCLTCGPKRLATWLSGSLELQAPIRNHVQPSHFKDGETKF